MPTVEYTLAGDASDLIVELAKTAKALEKQEKAVKDAQKAWDALTDEEKAAAKAAKDLADKQRDAADAAKKATKDGGKLKQGLEGLKNAAEGAGGKVGESAGRIEKFAQAGARLGGVLGPAAPLAAGLVVLAAGLASVIAGAAVTTVGVIKLIGAAEDLNRSLQPFEDLQGFDFVTDDQIRSVETFNDSLDGLKTIGQEMVVIYGAQLAPAFETAAVVLLKLGLVALDAYQALIKNRDAVRDTVNSLLPFGSVVTAAQDAVIGLADDGINKLDEATADYDERARSLIDTLRKQKNEIQDGGKAAAYQAKILASLTAAADKLKGVEEQVAGVNADAAEKAELAGKKRVEAILDVIAAQTDLLTNSRLTEDQQLAAIDNILQGNRLIAESERETADQIREIRNAEFTAEIEALAKREAEHEATMRRMADEEKRLREQATAATIGGVSSMLNAYSSLASTVISLNDGMTEKQRKTALALFRTSQVASLGDIAMNTAVAITKALATLGPVAGGIAVAGITATGAAQSAVVAAQKPPQFAFGGVVDEMAVAQDHRLVSASPGEGFLDRSTTHRIGGEEGIRDLTQGRIPRGLGGGAQVVQMVYKHRVFDAFVRDNIRKGGPLSSAINARRRVGHRRTS